MEIPKLRESIDTIDCKIQELFEERINVVSQIAKEKLKDGEPIYQPSRERELLYRVSERASDGLDTYTKVLYSTIMQISRAYQHDLSLGDNTAFLERFDDAAKNAEPIFDTRAVVACQGTEGAYSQIAADKLFKTPSIMYFSTFEKVCAAVESGLCEYGVLPIENSTAGSVNQVYDLMADHDFYIVNSTRVRIRHSLLAKPGAKLTDIKYVYSHPQALSQCTNFIGEHALVPKEALNTAESAKTVAQSDDMSVAAIASAECAELYGLCELASSVQNKDYNETRFICISKKMKFFEGAGRTSIRMHLKNKPGALYEVLSRFWARDINLVKLESRPIPGSDFEFMFYFDIEEPLHSPALRELLRELSAEGDFWYFGTYLES